MLCSLEHPRVGRELHSEPRIFRDLLAVDPACRNRELIRSLLRVSILKQRGEERTQPSVGNRILDSPVEPVILPLPKTVKVIRHERLGGVLKSYSRKAA